LPPLAEPPVAEPPLGLPPLAEPPFDPPPLPLSPASPAAGSSSPSIDVDCPPHAAAHRKTTPSAKICRTTFVVYYNPQTLTHSLRKHSTTAHVMSGQTRQTVSAVQSEADMHSGSGSTGGQTHSQPPFTHSIVPQVPPRHM
jgi:hypothetical protein